MAIFACAAHAEDALVSLKTIAVADFRVGTGVNLLGEQFEITTGALTERLITSLMDSHKFSVVERQKIDTLKKEADFFNKEGGPGEPGLAGADYYLFGSIASAQFGVRYETILSVEQYKQYVRGNLVVDVRLVDSRSGRLVCARRVEAGNSVESVTRDTSCRRVSGGFIDGIERRLVEKIVECAVDACYPLKVAGMSGDTAYLNRGAKMGMKKGQRIQAYEFGDAIVDPDTREVIGCKETVRATLEVVAVEEKVSQARVVAWEGQPCDLSSAVCRPVPGPAPPTRPPQLQPEPSNAKPNW